MVAPYGKKFVWKSFVLQVAYKKGNNRVKNEDGGKQVKVDAPENEIGQRLPTREAWLI